MDPLKCATDCGENRRLRQDPRFQEAKRLVDSQGPEQTSKFVDYMRGVKVATLTDRIRSAITDSGFTYYKIMQETGVSDAAIGRLISGERTITLETADALAAFLELDLTPKKKRRKALSVSDFELPFESEDFKIAWGDWLQHKRNLRKSWGLGSAQKALQVLADWGEKTAIESINFAIANNWVGFKNVREMQGSGSYGAKDRKQVESVADLLDETKPKRGKKPWKSRGGRVLGEEEQAALERERTPRKRRSRQSGGLKSAGEIIG